MATGLRHHELQLPLGMETALQVWPQHTLTLPRRKNQYGQSCCKLSNSYFFTKDFLYCCLFLKGCTKMTLSRKPGFHQFSLTILEGIHAPKQYYYYQQYYYYPYYQLSYTFLASFIRLSLTSDGITADQQVQICVFFKAYLLYHINYKPSSSSSVDSSH